MINKISKYFSLILLLVLVNSNFSFAITQMMCTMSKMQDACECGNSDGAKDIQFSSAESACCKINIKEINNSNLLQNTISKETKSTVSQNIVYYQNLYTRPETHTYFVFINKNFKPPKDIPILYSSLLIWTISFNNNLYTAL